VKKRAFFSFRHLFHKALVIKALKHVLSEDSAHALRKFFFKRFFRNATILLKTLFSSEEKFSTGRYFFHNLTDEKAFKKKLKEKNTLFVFGFSYCQKPFECPSSRFSSTCFFDPAQPICSECLIGKARQSIPPLSEILVIPTSFFFIERILALQKKHPSKEIVFLIFACPFAINLFAPWPSLFHLKGISFPLSGSLCTNFPSFKNAEKGEKNGLSFLQKGQKETFFQFLSLRKTSLEKN
jgi:hypothetical protein